MKEIEVTIPTNAGPISIITNSLSKTVLKEKLGKAMWGCAGQTKKTIIRKVNHLLKPDFRHSRIQLTEKGS